MKTAARPVRQGESRRFLARLPLLWQWLLVFVLSVAILRHWRWLQLSASLEEVAPGAQGKELPGQPAHGSLSRRDSALPARDCPVSVPWDTLPRDPGKTRAAVFTPYNIVFGGGERYLLSVVAVMQDLGYTVDVLTFRRNVCQTKEQLLKVAAGLRVALKPELVNLHHVTVQGIHIQAPAEGYSVFMALGNDKLPTFAGLGHVNFYMCQFPFDLDRPPRPGTTKALASYDYVLLNSGFTDGWYSRYAGPHIENALRVWNSAPSVVVLYPPVEPFPAKSQLKKTGAADGDDAAAQPKREHILLLGRFFKGRQSKGHAAAIDIFERILPQLPPSTQLHLVGNLMPEHKDYLNNLRTKAQHLPVHFHVGVAAHVIEELMHTCLVQWHLTGIDLGASVDPASEEHFGISVAEGMSAGIIPVVLNRGGVTDIVKQGLTGFLASDAEAIAQTTLEVYQLPDEEREALRRAAISWVERFSSKAFARNFHVLANRGVLTKPFRFLQQQTMDVVLSRSFVLPKASKKAALIIEPRQHYAFEYCVKNVLFHLGPEWALHVYHGTANERFVRHALAGTENVHFRPLDTVTVPIPMLNQLLKSPDFWEELAEQGVEHVLFFQTDSLLVHGDVAPFLKYHYVGAPWHRQNERWGPAQKAMPHGVGNGGLSLRSVPAMLALARQHGANRSAAQQEDFFYAGLMERMPEYQLAPRPLAYQFCVEVPCDDVEAEAGAQPAPGAPLQTLPHVPMALHASWYYFWGNSQRFGDLLALLEMSVCGPDAYRSARGSSVSPEPALLWEDSHRASRALGAARARHAKHAKQQKHVQTGAAGQQQQQQQQQAGASAG